jgi:hypothetical protein
MRYKNIHLSDGDLIMAADGELPARRKAEVSAHLDGCWSCRERMRSMEATISDFVRARNQDLDRELHDRTRHAAGPRALLRARLAEAARKSAPDFAWRHAIRRMVPAGGVFFAVLGAVFMIFQATVSAEGPKPKSGLTPGETRPITIAEMCRRPQAEVISNIPEETRRQVFAEYGINNQSENFEVDYLITPDLGGTESLRNLWPQPYSVRWNAHVKDRLEERLHELVCSGKLDLPTAQRDIAVNWIDAYKKYVGGN